MNNTKTDYTTIRVSKDTKSLIENLRILIGMRDHRKYNTDESLEIFLTESLDDIQSKIQVSGFQWRDVLDQENKNKQNQIK